MRFATPPRELASRANAFEQRDVSEILLAARRLLVGDQIFERDDRDRQIAQADVYRNWAQAGSKL